MSVLSVPLIVFDCVQWGTGCQIFIIDLFIYMLILLVILVLFYAIFE